MKRAAILIICLGFVIRLFCFQYTSIINPDGGLYIHQARALYYGLNDSITSCFLVYLSNYSIFVAGAYAILGDWVIAAKSVSLLFGTITLIPLYFLSKRFFDCKISILVTLIYALIPVFIDRSVDVVRAPVFWFFSMLGLYLFINQIGKRNNLYLFLSSLSFLMATWARVEAFLFIIISCFYILAVREKGRFEKLMMFIMPVAIIMFIAASGLIISMSNLNIFRNVNIFSYKNIVSHLLSSISGYENIRVDLNDLINQPIGEIPRRFLIVGRHLAWWIALGTLLTSMVEAFFYPFFIVFIVGSGKMWGKIKKDPCVFYLAILSISAFFLLYAVVLKIWEMPTRYMGIFIFPSFIFIGFGLEKIIHFFRSRFNFKESVALSVVCLLILACSLPKNLKPRETDKLVFKNIGEFIANREGNNKEITVATSQHSIRWISFYANKDYKGAPCPEKNYDLENLIGKNYGEFIQNLKRRGIKYFLWEEKHWPKESFYFIKNQNPKDFIKVGNWSHPDTGRLILFEVI